MKLGYARKSKGEPENLSEQISRLKKAGADEILSEIKSGRTEDRRQFKKLMQLLESGRVRELIVTRLDRLGRSVISLNRVLVLVEKKKVKLTIIDAPITDPSSPFGWLSLNQMSMQAEFESRMLASRVRNGMNYIREQGKVFKAAFGYSRNENGTLVPNEATWQIAQKSVEIYIKVGSLRGAIAQIWELYQIKWSTAGFSDWLKNPQLRGHTAYTSGSTPDIRYNTHTALINQSTWEQIEFLLKRGKSMRGINANSPTVMKYPLAGLVYCGDCGSRCYRHILRNKYEVFRCRKRDEGAQFCGNKRSASVKEVEQAAIAQLVTRSREIAQLVNQPDNIVESPKLKELRSQLAGLQALGNNPAILAAIDELRSQICLEESQAAHYSRNEEILTELLEVYQNPHFFEDETVENKILLYRRLIEQIVVLNGDVIKVELLI